MIGCGGKLNHLECLDIGRRGVQRCMESSGEKSEFYVVGIGRGHISKLFLWFFCGWWSMAILLVKLTICHYLKSNLKAE